MEEIAVLDGEKLSTIQDVEGGILVHRKDFCDHFSQWTHRKTSQPAQDDGFVQTSTCLSVHCWSFFKVHVHCHLFSTSCIQTCTKGAQARYAPVSGNKTGHS